MIIQYSNATHQFVNQMENQYVNIKRPFHDLPSGYLTLQFQTLISSSFMKTQYLNIKMSSDDLTDGYSQMNI